MQFRFFIIKMQSIISKTNNAIKNGKGNALIEVTEEYNMLNLLIVAFFWTKVEGTAVQVRHAGEEIE